MKILLIHNNYGAYSGEEAVVDLQAKMFRQMGHEVSFFRKTTEGIRGTLMGNINGLLSGFYAPQAVKEVKQLMHTYRPDVAVVHNLYPFISPAILRHVKKAGVPIVMTVHNYRLMCPTGLFMRDAAPCELCLSGSEWNCIKYNCEYSRLKSVGYAGRNWYARKTRAFFYVDMFACITRFQIEKLTEAGFAKERMAYLPNFVEKVGEMPSPQSDHDTDYVAVSGRMSREKGIDLLIDIAQRTPHIQYVFAGSVRQEDNLMVNLPANCTFLGHLQKEQLSEFYLKARFLVIASRWYEGFPMTILDASQYAKPAIGPAHAGFLEIIDHESTGLHFKPGDVHDLEDKINRLWNDPDACRKMGEEAFRKLQRCYTAEVVSREWEERLIELKTKS